MLIAQITDLHLGATHGGPDATNEARLDEVLARLKAMDPRPELLLVTGDLTESGDAASFRAVAERLEGFGCPVLLSIGNHDDRANFRAQFPMIGGAKSGVGDGGDDGSGDFIQYVHEAEALRVIVLDSVDADRHGGAFCEARARWLAARLDEAPHAPTLVTIHHPPIESGIGWMTVAPHEPWVERLSGVLAGRGNVIALLSGHLHRPIVSHWADQTVVVCPSVAPPVALELAPLAPERPDGRPLILDGPPCYALHLWTGERLITHFVTADDQTAVASFDAGMQRAIEKLVNEPRSA